MIIRTQDKRSIVNLDRLDTICNKTIRNKGEINEQYPTTIHYYSGVAETMGVLGNYSSEEKAIKVLDMIVECYRSESFTDGVVFQMPQDSEV